MKTQPLFSALLLTASLFIVPGLQAQASLVADLNPGVTGSFPSNLTSYANSLVFGAYTTQTGFELYRFDATGIHLAAEINATSDDIGAGTMEGNGSIPSGLTVYNGALFFSAYDPHRGAELWKYDGNSAMRVADISADNNDTIKPFPNSSWPSQLTVFNNKLYFVANSGVISTNYELWVHDGVGTTLAANIHPDGPGDQSSYPSAFTVFNNALYFMADDGAHGYELWKHDGVVATMLADINPGGADSSSYPKHFTAVGDTLYFQAYSSVAGFELWKTDGQTASLAADIAAGTGSSAPSHLIAFNGALYFMADDGVSGYELWRYDGINASLVRDLNPAGSSYPKNFVVHNGSLYFAADDGVHGWELWKYDGAAASLVADINVAGDAFPEELKILNGELFFIADSADTGREVWTLRAGTPALAADVNPGPGSSYPQFLTAFGGGLFFRAAGDGLNDFELWRLDPVANAAPTVRLASPTPNATFTTADPVVVSAEATDDSGVMRVEFFANGQLVHRANESPYSFSTNFLSGTYTLTAIAYDAAGLNATSGPVTITVSAQSTDIPPTIRSIELQGADVIITVEGKPGVTHSLQASEDLSNWATVQTETPTSATFQFSRPIMLTPRVFYRVLANP